MLEAFCWIAGLWIAASVLSWCMASGRADEIAERNYAKRRALLLANKQ